MVIIGVCTAENATINKSKRQLTASGIPWAALLGTVTIAAPPSPTLSASMATQRKPRYYARSTVAARMVKLLGMKLHIENCFRVLGSYKDWCHMTNSFQVHAMYRRHRNREQRKKMTAACLHEHECARASVMCDILQSIYVHLMSSSSCHIKAGEPPSSVSSVYFSYLLVRKDLVAVTTLCFACKNELLALCKQRRNRLKDAEGLCI